jgi:iron complex transport system substrate-binding protein
VTKRAALALGLSLAVIGGPARSLDVSAKPASIVSLNTCTDELVLRLADRAAIASVTWLSQDPRNANMAQLARTIPANHRLVEQVRALEPDLVAGAYTTRNTVALLKRVGVPVREFGVPRNLAEMRDEIAEMAGLLGQPERGQALITEINRRLDASKDAYGH